MKNLTTNNNQKPKMMEKKLEKASWIFYQSWEKSINLLTMEERGQLLTNLINYHKEEEITLNTPMLEMFWNSIEFNLIRNVKRYNASVENGAKGGPPKGNTNAKKQPKNNLNQPNIQPTFNLKQPNIQPTFNQVQPTNDLNDNVNVNGNEDVNKNKNVDVNTNEYDSVNTSTFSNQFETQWEEIKNIANSKNLK